jgi:hypothetical protein
VASVDLLELVEMIRRAKKRVAEPSDLDRLRIGKLDGYNLLGVSSWRGLGLDKADFGGGRPVRVLGNWEDEPTLPMTAACLPSQDDYYVISRCVREEHIHAFRRELLTFISSLSSKL